MAQPQGDEGLAVYAAAHGLAVEDGVHLPRTTPLLAEGEVHRVESLIGGWLSKYVEAKLAVIDRGDATFTVAVYLAEHHAKGSEIHGLWDSFLFSASQLLTGSSVANPKTNFGKVLEFIFDLWAIFVVASLAGSFGAFFHARSKELNEEMERAEEKLRRSVERDAAANEPGR